MSAALTLATPEHRDAILRLVADFHADQGIESSDENRSAAICPLLEGIPHGCAYLIGPARAPIGYIVVTFGWSIEFGGLDGVIDELFIRPPVRGRGIATEALMSLAKALSNAGVQALHLQVNSEDKITQRLYTRTGFRERSGEIMMTKRL